MIKFKIKTSELEIDIEDEYIYDHKGYTSHSLPSIIDLLKDAIKHVSEATINIIKERNENNR